MRTERPDPALPLVRIFAVGGFISLVALTLLDRGASRMYALPWKLLWGFAQLAPIAALLLRAISLQTPFRLPARAGCWLAAIFGAGVLLSALTSPHSGQSLLWALPFFSALAAFFLLHDWVARDADAPRRLRWLGGLFLAAIVLTSLLRWTAFLSSRYEPGKSLSWLLLHRNDAPLGHSNYTAGLALLALPWFGGLAVSSRRAWRFVWGVFTALALLMLFSSGSRAGLPSLVVICVGAAFAARLSWRKLALGLVIAVFVAGAVGYMHPRIRAMVFSPKTLGERPDPSARQRSAMIYAGLEMGRDRPLTGWGPGTTPLVFPRYRGTVDSGVEDALQLHSTPLEVWSELGLVGIGCAIGFIVLAARGFRREPAAALALGAYLTFALFDYQLDAPFFLFALAACGALLGATDVDFASKPARFRLAIGLLVATGVIALLGRTDPTPAMNVRALALGRDPAHAEQAIALLNNSLTRNPNQEIAHFNLGWLLVMREPAVAEAHFLAAAKLVPDKGGVYFGLGLARLNQGRTDDAVQAFALEGLNDPLFLTSPWWREDTLKKFRTPTLLRVGVWAREIATQELPAGAYVPREAAYLSALAAWLAQRDIPGEILSAANTSDRVGYFARRPALPDFLSGPVISYRRERTAYPLLMRDLDLPTPVDVFDVQENAIAARDLQFLFPPKGWVPGPLLLRRLQK